MRNNRLFMVPVSEISEHPFEGEPTEGVLEGWEAYAPNWGNGSCNPMETVCLESPKVENFNGSYFIEIGGSHYWYHAEKKDYYRKGWYQSGKYLRFLRKRVL